MNKALLTIGLTFAFGGVAIAQTNEAEMRQIDRLQWVLEWQDCSFINAQNAICDRENPQENAISITATDGKETYLYMGSEVVFPDYGNSFSINLSGTDAAEGEYELFIPESYVLLYPGRIPNPAQTLTLTISDAPSEITYPVKISDLSGNSFEIYWENATSLEAGITQGAYIENIETGDRYDMLFLKGVEFSKANLRISGRYLYANITNNYPDLPDGTYSLYLPADYVKFNGTEKGNEVVDDYEFTYVAPWSEGKVETEGPTEEGIITITWTQASDISINEDYKGDGWGMAGITIYDGADEQLDVPYPTNVTVSENILTISLKGLDIMSGNCQLVVPEGYLFVTVKDETNLTTGVTYRFEYDNPESAVATLDSDRGRYTIVSLSGRTVLDTKDPSEADALPRGIYIVNGKKIIR